MDTLAKSDAFFFITTICIVLVTIVIVVVGAYLIKIVADVKQIVARAKEEANEIADDLKSAREGLKDKGRSIGSVLAAIFAFGMRKRKKRRDNDE